MPIHFIDSKCNIKQLKSHKTCLTNHTGSIWHHIMPLVINALRIGHTDTHMHTYRHVKKSNFKKLALAVGCLMLVYKWLHFARTNRQLAWNHYKTGWWGWAYVLWYVELKAAWIDIPYMTIYGIYNFWMEIPNCYPPVLCIPTEVLVVLTTLWNELSKMAGNPTKHSLWSWSTELSWVTID